MKKFSHFFVWGTASLTFASFELLALKPQFHLYIAGFLLLLIPLTVWHLVGYNLKLKFWNFLISPLLLVASQFLFMIFLEGRMFWQVALAVLTIFLAIFLENIYIYFNRPLKYQTYSILNISSYLNLLIVFQFTVGFFWLIIFLGFSTWLATLLTLIYTTLLIYQVMWVADISIAKSGYFIFGIPLIMAEFFWAISFFPTSVYVNGIILTIIYYFLSGIARNHLLKILDKKVVWRYILISGLSLLVTLATAKWI